MSEIQLTHFSFGGESPDRSRIHQIALRDARIAADHHETAAGPVRSGLVARLGLISRVRLAFAGGPRTTEPWNCPA
jgi:hypothetical protein